MDVHPATHPTDQTLSSYGLGKLDDASAESVHKHLEECPVCRKRVAAISPDTFLGRLRDAQGRPDSPASLGPSLAGLSMLAAGSPSPAPPATSTLPTGTGRPPRLRGHPRARPGRHGRRLPGREQAHGSQGSSQGRQLAPLEPQGRAGALPRRDPPRGPAPSPQRGHGLLGPSPRREPGAGHGVRRGPRPGEDRQGPRAAAGRQRLQLCPPGGAGLAARRTSMAWSTATSSPATSCSLARGTARWSRCSTSAWPR